MTPQIPQWAYPSRPSGWVRYGGFKKSDADPTKFAPVWRGRVPVWASCTGDIHDGDCHLLIIRVLPEIDVILAADWIECDDPAQIHNAIHERKPAKRWPVRNWRLSHLAYLTHVVQKPKPGSTATLRLCGGRLPDTRKKLQQLAFITLPEVPVTIVPASKTGTEDWDIQIKISKQPKAMRSWYDLALWMALYEPWERTMVFKALGHLMPHDMQYVLESTCGRILGRIQRIGQPNAAYEVKLQPATLRLLGEPPESYAHPAEKIAVDDAELRAFSALLTGMTRMPMPITFVDQDKDTVTALEALENLTWARPHHFDNKGRLLTAEPVVSQAVLDMRFDKQTKSLQYSLALLSPRYPIE